jgi:hypothetical protein
MNTAEQFHVDQVSPSYWRVTFDNGPVNLLDPDTAGRPENRPFVQLLLANGLQQPDGIETNPASRSESCDRTPSSREVCGHLRLSRRASCLCYARAAFSSRREPIPSLAKTFRRCHSTVRADRYSCAPISALVRPSRASRAIRASMET